jgi:hypothetical protein
VEVEKNVGNGGIRIPEEVPWRILAADRDDAGPFSFTTGPGEP